MSFLNETERKELNDAVLKTVNKRMTGIEISPDKKSTHRFIHKDFSIPKTKLVEEREKGWPIDTCSLELATARVCEGCVGVLGKNPLWVLESFPTIMWDREHETDDEIQLKVACVIVGDGEPNV
jgi:hypothetical protein